MDSYLIIDSAVVVCDLVHVQHFDGFLFSAPSIEPVLILVAALTQCWVNDSILGEWWVTVVDGDPPLTRHWVNGGLPL